MKQHYDEHINGAENTGTQDQDSEGVDFVSIADTGNQPATTIGEVKDAVQQLKINEATEQDGILEETHQDRPEKGFMNHIYKNGDWQCENYLTNSILNYG